MLALAAITVGTGGAGLAAVITAAVETTLGGVGLSVAGVGGSGVVGALVGCIARCW